jgi:hypothetical protein
MNLVTIHHSFDPAEVQSIRSAEFDMIVVHDLASLSLEGAAPSGEHSRKFRKRMLT